MGVIVDPELTGRLISDLSKRIIKKPSIFGK